MPPDSDYPIQTGLRDPLTNEFFPENTIERVLFTAESIHLYSVPAPTTQLASSAGLINISTLSSVTGGIPSARKTFPSPSLSSRDPVSGLGTRTANPRFGPGPTLPARGGPPSNGNAAVPARPRPMGGPVSPFAANTEPTSGNTIRAARWTMNPQDHILEGRLRIVEYMIPVPVEELSDVEPKKNFSTTESTSLSGETLYITNTFILIEKPPSSSPSSEWTLHSAIQYVRPRIQSQSPKSLPSSHSTSHTSQTSSSALTTEVDTTAVQPASDSSRFFAVRVFHTNESRKKSLLGLGFEDRDAAFEFSVVLGDVARRVEDAGGINLGKTTRTRALGASAPGPVSVSPGQSVRNESMGQGLGRTGTPDGARSSDFAAQKGSSSGLDGPSLTASSENDLSIPSGQKIRVQLRSSLARRERSGDDRGAVETDTKATPTTGLKSFPSSSSSFLLPPPPPPSYLGSNRRRMVPPNNTQSVTSSSATPGSALGPVKHSTPLPQTSPLASSPASTLSSNSFQSQSRIQAPPEIRSSVDLTAPSSDNSACGVKDAPRISSTTATASATGQTDLKPWEVLPKRDEFVERKNERADQREEDDFGNFESVWNVGGKAQADTKNMGSEKETGDHGGGFVSHTFDDDADFGDFQ